MQGRQSDAVFRSSEVLAYVRIVIRKIHNHKDYRTKAATFDNGELSEEARGKHIY